MDKSLKTLSLDIEAGELLLNGKKLEDVSYMQLTFESGEWDLTVKHHMSYGPSGKFNQEQRIEK